MYYDTVPRSRKYISWLNVAFPIGIGFYLWQVILGQGLDLVEQGTSQSASFGFNVFAKTLVWGSPLYAFCACAVFLGAVWYASAALNFSLRRRVQHLKLGATMFISGFVLSLLGILAGLSDTPPLNLVYQPILDALNH